MRRISLMIVVVATVVCGQSDPCLDARYLGLKNKSLDEMTEREYEFFGEREKLCAQKAFSDAKGVASPDFRRVQVLKSVSIPLMILGYACVGGFVPLTILSAAVSPEVAFGFIPVGSGALVFASTGHVLYARARGIQRTGLSEGRGTAEMGLAVHF